MTFTAQTFTNGDTLSALELNTMVANDAHVRHESEGKTILTLAQVVEENELNLKFRLSINTVDIGTEQTGSGAFSETNVNIGPAGLALADDAVHSIRLEIGTSPFEYDMPFKFYKTEDMVYLSYWGDLEDTGSDIRVNALSVICHRTTI